MQIPSSPRRKALLIIDAQPAFTNRNTQSALTNIVSLIRAVSYPLYVEAIFSAGKDSLWDRQTGWFLPRTVDSHTVDEVRVLLNNRPVVTIHKEAKSIFHGDKDLDNVLRLARIEEVHLVGFDINDCVLASALAAFDLGYFTYVIEECCAASSDPQLEVHAREILRHLHLTNYRLGKEHDGWKAS